MQFIFKRLLSWRLRSFPHSTPRLRRNTRTKLYEKTDGDPSQLHWRATKTTKEVLLCFWRRAFASYFPPFERFYHGLIDWLVAWSFDWFVVCLIDWLISCFIGCINCSISDTEFINYCTAKWVSIRNSFNRFLLKNERKPSGSGRGETTVKPYKFAKQLAFLRQHIKSRRYQRRLIDIPIDCFLEVFKLSSNLSLRRISL